MTAMMAVCMLAAHDEAWFRNLYAETYRPLLAYARRRVDAATADEVVADTFLTAWRRRDDVPDSSERPWLLGVARNMIRNAARSSRRREAAQQRLRIAHAPDAAEGATFDSDNRVAMLRTALGSLSETDREVLMLVAWEQLSHAEIGQVLGISANASAIRVHRARKRLAARLEHLDHAGTDEGKTP
jgi:RNA polymerase sigma-70 factor (ECF subfamily)